METNQSQNEGQPQFKYPEPQNSNFLQSTTARVFMVGLLTLVLLLPLEYVKALIRDRKELQEGVTNEMAEKWGGSVYFYGPVLKVPYQTISETELQIKLPNRLPYNDLQLLIMLTFSLKI